MDRSPSVSPHQRRASIKKRRLLPHSLLRIPRIMIVGKCQNRDSPLLDLLEKADPLGKITLAIKQSPGPKLSFFPRSLSGPLTTERK